ncbi:hypothetical protein [Haloarcula amylovorans]|nr:hypothetical protein [Halomicroarcula amylolytica]
MKDEDSDEIEQIDSDEIPDDATVLQCGAVVTDEGTIGRIEQEDD